MSEILDAIRKAIANGTKTRYQLWQETGIDQAQLSRMMSGKSGMSLDNAEKLAKALGLKITIKAKGDGK